MFKKLKTELFYARRMSQWGYGLRDWYRYVLNKFFSLQLLARVKPIQCIEDADFELHILAPRNGLWMAYWAIRSFMYYSGHCPRVVIHDDGSIDDKAKWIFENKLPNAHVLYRKEAKRLFFSDPNIPDLVKKYRRECKNFYIMMFVDHFFLSKSNKVMVMDNDVLFYNKPNEIIDFLENKNVLDAVFYGSEEWDGNPLDVTEEYKNKYSSILADASRLNSGVMLFNKNKFDYAKITEYFENVTKPHGDLIEQTGWGMILCQNPHKFLPEERYVFRGSIGPSVVAKHFTKPRRHEMFARGIDEVRKRIGV